MCNGQGRELYYGIKGKPVYKGAELSNYVKTIYSTHRLIEHSFDTSFKGISTLRSKSKVLWFCISDVVVWENIHNMSFVRHFFVLSHPVRVGLECVVN